MRQVAGDSSDSTPLAPEEQPRRPGVSLEPAEWLAAVAAGALDAPRGTEVGSSVLPAARADLPELVEGWVRRIALGGDQRRAVARLDIGHGRYSGTEVVIAAEGGRQVSVELTLPQGAPSDGLSQRLTERLVARGYRVNVSVG